MVPDAPAHDRLAPAQTLDRYWETLDVGPLRSEREFQAFYCAELNEVRGEDNVPALTSGLNRSFGGRFFHAFLAGHTGCGKSTELGRLANNVKERFRTVRFSAKDDLHPSSAKPFDVLILMMLRLHEEASKKDADGGISWEPPEDLSRRVLNWFAAETKTTKTSFDMRAGIAPLFKWLSGEIKFSSERSKEVIEYRVSHLRELIELVNEFFNACNDHLRFRREQEWLFIGEDFEKLLDPNIAKDFFVTQSAVFSNLRAHLVFTIPVALAWSEQGVSLPFQVYTIPDTPVYDAGNNSDENGRGVLRRLLTQRVNLDLIDRYQLERLIVASGGHLRDLFSLLREAADRALLAKPPGLRVREADVSRVIAKQRQTFLLRLGDNAYEDAATGWPVRAERLVKIYRREPGASIPDAVLRSLLYARAVQEFNGKGRFAVAPLVVDILLEHGRIQPPESPEGLLPPTPSA